MSSGPFEEDASVADFFDAMAVRDIDAVPVPEPVEMMDDVTLTWYLRAARDS